MILPNTFQAAADGTLMFPQLRGLTLEYTVRPTFDTIVQKAADRSTTRLQIDPYPLWEYDLTFGFVSNDTRYNLPNNHTNPTNKTDYEQIVGLFLACGGQRDTFLFDLAQLTLRPNDSSVTNVQIGTGDGTTTAFQLVRPLGGFLDLVDNPIESSIKVVAGASAATVSSVAAGMVTLAAAPAAGAAVRASFKWLHRLRFVNDQEEFQAMWFNLYQRDKLKLIQERNVLSVSGQPVFESPRAGIVYLEQGTGNPFLVTLQADENGVAREVLSAATSSVGGVTSYSIVDSNGVTRTAMVANGRLVYS